MHDTSGLFSYLFLVQIHNDSPVKIRPLSESIQPSAVANDKKSFPHRAIITYMDDLTFKVTIGRQISQLSYMLIVYGLLAITYLYFMGFKMPHVFGYVFGGIFLFDMCPTLIAHFQYLNANSNALLAIDKEHRKIEYFSGKESFTYHIDEIEALQLISSYGGGAWYSFSEYRYCKIIFRDKRQVIITCLMMADIKDTLPMLFGIPAQRKYKIVAFI